MGSYVAFPNIFQTSYYHMHLQNAYSTPNFTDPFFTCEFTCDEASFNHRSVNSGLRKLRQDNVRHVRHGLSLFG